MKRKVIGETLAGLPISPIVQVGDFLFIAGQVGIKESGILAGTDIKSQTRQALINLRNALVKAGSELDKVDSITVYLVQRENFQEMNNVYKEFFTHDYPARTTIIAATLVDPKYLVEISAIAHI